MILRATFENVLSFNERTSINLTAGKDTTHPTHISQASNSEDVSCLKFGVIYGANASGKSNIFKAISILQQIALGGFPSSVVELFKLSGSIKPVSKVEVEFKTSGKYYAYGVEFSLKGIYEEWLYELNNQNDKRIFTRAKTDDGPIVEFGNIDGDESTKQFFKFLGQSTPVQKSFLSEYNVRNGIGLDGVKEAYNWFAKGLRIIFPDSRYRGIWYNAEQDEDFLRLSRELLEYFGTGIVDIRYLPVPSLRQTYLPQDVIEELTNNIASGRTAMVAVPETNESFIIQYKVDGFYKISKQKTVYQNDNKEEVILEMSEESSGVIRLLEFIRMLIDLRRGDVDFLIDDFDRSLHPLLTQKIIECYLDGLSEERDTQLVISTHECNLLNHDFLRADEVWFVQKRKNNSSRLVSLAEFKPREDIQKAYLQGRYGAIPFFPALETLNYSSDVGAS